MGVSHLHKHASAAQAAKANSGYADSKIVAGGVKGKSGGTDGVGKGLGSAVPYSKEAVKALSGPAQAAKNGARIGAKSGQPKLGKSMGSGLLHKAFPNGNAGKAGGK